MLEDREVYKVARPWIDLNYNVEVENACAATGGAPALHSHKGALMPIAEVTSARNEQRYVHGAGTVRWSIPTTKGRTTV